MSPISSRHQRPRLVSALSMAPRFRYGRSRPSSIQPPARPSPLAASGRGWSGFAAMRVMMARLMRLRMLLRRRVCSPTGTGSRGRPGRFANLRPTRRRFGAAISLSGTGAPSRACVYRRPAARGRRRVWRLRCWRLCCLRRGRRCRPAAATYRAEAPTASNSGASMVMPHEALRGR